MCSKHNTMIYLVLLIIASPVLGKLKPQSHIVTQKECPINIEKYKAWYDNDICHMVYAENISTKKIVAVQFGFISFDVWNQYLHKGDGLKITNVKPMGLYNKLKCYESFMSAYAPESFHTGYTYVAKVRFDDDTFWFILSQIKTLFSEKYG